ncbi:MAG: hypothetical protein CSA42_01005 [Gammaproteobacteria bacterium]|nr:MAG: hypothetical protein CSA42_01005 [Gammaproteobacteria bacterium]
MVLILTSNNVSEDTGYIFPLNSGLKNKHFIISLLSFIFDKPYHVAYNICLMIFLQFIIY